MSTLGSEPPPVLPEGRYLSLSSLFFVGAGGQTKATFGRNRLLTQLGGRPTTMLTLDANPRYDEIRDYYTATGELVEGMGLLNIHEWFRTESGPLASGPPGDPMFAIGADEIEMVPLDDYREHTVSHPSGVALYRSYADPKSENETAREYLRPDGSAYLRTPAGSGHAVTPYVLLDAAGKPLGAWPRISGWYWAWLRSVVGKVDRVFLFCDSRPALAALLPAKDPRFHMVFQVHNAHLRGTGSWNSWMVPDYEPLFASIPQLDALVLLSTRQRQDVAQRFGDTNNLFSVPNTVETPDLPDPMPSRDRATFAIVSRLTPQKNLVDAVDTWALVVQRRPEARLLIYGDGRLRGRLQRRIEQHGLGDSVRLMGYDRSARERLLTATGFLMTSVYEGYPLATLESLSFGCPVLSYDVMYGPQDQVTDGEDGFLVPQRDMAALADRVVRLIDDPALVERLSRGALRRAREHDHEAYVARWAATLRQVAAQKPTRVAMKVAFEVHELGYAAPDTGLVPRGRGLARRLLGHRTPGPLEPRPAETRPASWSGDEPVRIRFRGTIVVRGRIPRGALRGARPTLHAVSPSGQVIVLPLRVDRERRRYRLASEFGLDRALRGLAPDDRSVGLRLRMVVKNAAWETELARPPAGESAHTGYEVAFGEDGTLRLRGHPRPDGVS